MISEQAGRAIVRERAGGICEAAIPGECFGRHDSVHHRLKRSHGGSWNPSNLLGICGDGTRGCHGYIEAFPEWARGEGLWIFTGDGEPDQISVHMRWTQTAYRSWWLLDDEGLLHSDAPGDQQLVTYHPRVRDFMASSLSAFRASQQ